MTTPSVNDAAYAYYLAGGGGGGGGGLVDSVNGRTGAVVLTATDVNLDQVNNTSDTSKVASGPIATALAAKAPLASPTFTGTVVVPVASGGTSPAQKTYVDSAVAGLAPLASPIFTGNPTAPTPTAGDNDTSIATTAFVTTADNLKANAANAALTGTPTAPTAAAGTNTTQLATTAFVKAAVDTAVPLASGGQAMRLVGYGNTLPASGTQIGDVFFLEV